MISQSSSPQLTPADWGAIGGFALLIIGLSFVNMKLASFVGLTAILLIVLKGWGLEAKG